MGVFLAALGCFRGLDMDCRVNRNGQLDWGVLGVQIRDFRGPDWGCLSYPNWDVCPTLIRVLVITILGCLPTPNWVVCHHHIGMLPTPNWDV